MILNALSFETLKDLHGVRLSKKNRPQCIEMKKPTCPVSFHNPPDTT
jgi:hypothetical protein